ncbi:hypothetical protein P9112_013001 [Eukaryota sp. TZLM1-RC]
MPLTILPYISGVAALPWIIIGFIVNSILCYCLNPSSVIKAMKAFGKVLLFVFIPLLQFRIFLSIPFGLSEISFSITAVAVMLLLYLVSYYSSKLRSRSLKLCIMENQEFLKTCLTNQGRSSAFIGGSLLSIAAWEIQASLYMALYGVFLFVLIPIALSRMSKKDVLPKELQDMSSPADVDLESNHTPVKPTSPIPLYLQIFPVFLLVTIAIAIILNRMFDITMESLGKPGEYIHLVSAFTVPLGLYYAGSGVKAEDLKWMNISQVFSTQSQSLALRSTSFTLFINLVISPLIIGSIFGVLTLFKIIDTSWFSVIFINTILPTTPTNIFLEEFGINKKATALTVSTSTALGVPLVLIMIPLLNGIFN